MIKTETSKKLNENDNHDDGVLDAVGRLLVFLSLTEQGTEMIERGTFILKHLWCFFSGGTLLKQSQTNIKSRDFFLFFFFKK